MTEGAAHHSLSISVSSYVLAVSRRRNRRDRLGGRSCKTHRPMLIEAPFNEITGEIIAAAIEVHRALGPGLLESTYSECLPMEVKSVATILPVHHAQVLTCLRLTG